METSHRARSGRTTTRECRSADQPIERGTIRESYKRAELKRAPPFFTFTCRMSGVQRANSLKARRTRHCVKMARWTRRPGACSGACGSSCRTGSSHGQGERGGPSARRRPPCAREVTMARSCANDAACHVSLPATRGPRGEGGGAWDPQDFDDESEQTRGEPKLLIGFFNLKPD